MDQPTLSGLAKDLEDVRGRLARLESTVFKDQPAPAPTPPVVPANPSEPPPLPVPVPNPVPPKPAPPVVPAPAPVPAVPSAPPFKINPGKLLNFGGVAFGVIGLAFLAIYTWEYFGPAFKVGAGLLGALALVVGGEVIARRNKDVSWYGQGLIGGGYALGYFMVYAMHNVPGLTILSSTFVDLTLLLSLAAVCMLHAVRRSAEPIAILSTLLAFVTISLSNLHEFSVVASGVLLLGLAAAVLLKRWYGVLACSVIGSYAAFALFTDPRIASSGLTADMALTLSAGFLGVYWLVHHFVSVLVARDEKEGNVAVAVSVVNALAFVILGMVALEGHGFTELRWLFLTGTGAAYLATAPLASMRSSNLAIASTLIGLQLVTAAVPLKIDAQAVPAVWMTEVALLAWAGLRFNLIAFRWFATGLSVVLGVYSIEVLQSTKLVSVLGATFEWRLMIGAIGVAAAALASLCYGLPKLRANAREYEKKYWHNGYYVAAAVLCCALISTCAPIAVRPLLVVVEAVALLLLTRTRGDMVKQGVVALLTAFAFGNMLFFYETVALAQSLLVLTIGGAIGLFYRFGNPGLGDEENRLGYHGYTLATAATGGLLAIAHLGFAPASTALVCGAGAVFGAALLLRDRVLGTGAMLGLALGTLATVVNATEWTWANVLPSVAVGYAISAVFTALHKRGGFAGAKFVGYDVMIQTEESNLLRSLTGVGTSAVLAAAFAALLANSSHVSVAWGVQGLMLIAAGFATRNEWFKNCGLLIFAALAGKVLVFDLSGAPALQRILSCIVTAVAFLGGSWAYAWLGRTLGGTDDSSADETKPPLDGAQGSQSAS